MHVNSFFLLMFLFFWAVCGVAEICTFAANTAITSILMEANLTSLMAAGFYLKFKCLFSKMQEHSYHIRSEIERTFKIQIVCLLPALPLTFPCFNATVIQVVLLPGVVHKLPIAAAIFLKGSRGLGVGL